MNERLLSKNVILLKVRLLLFWALEKFLLPPADNVESCLCYVTTQMLVLKTVFCSLIFFLVADNHRFQPACETLLDEAAVIRFL